MSGVAGDQQVGSYRILQPLGAGGMSSVFRAVHVDTGHEVALKILTRTLARNSTLLQRFLREAKSAEALVHPNIVTIYDRGIDLGRHYIVLEYVAGGDFHDYVRTHGPMDAATATSVIRDIALGLNYAASQGLIHRDIKPSNILRTPTGQIKIIDLGLALHSDFEDERVTREGTTVGTVDYMAPEQARDSRAASIQSDIYSLGCTFYYLLTGIPPYPGGDITDKLTRHARAAVPNVADLRPDIPAQLAATIERMMAKQPEDRFASYDGLISALDQAPVDAKDRSIAYPLVPLAKEGRNDVSDVPVIPDEEAGAEEASADLSLGSIPVFPVESQTGSLALESEASLAAPRTSSQPSPPIPRLSRLAAEDPAAGVDDQVEIEPFAATEPGPTVSASIWIVGCLAVGVACIFMFMGLIQYMDLKAQIGGAEQANSGADLTNQAGGPTTQSPDGSRAVDRRPMPVHSAARSAKSPARVNAQEPAIAWKEPVDSLEELPPQNACLSDLDKGTERLPDWARSPIPDRVDGLSVVVRRIVEAGESQTVPEIHMALDRYVKGAVELADEGPFYEDDFHVAGQARLIRTRPDCRSIVAIEGGRNQAVRDQPAVVMLDRKSLILDGIDLIVNARELASRQTALFSCSGASLTLKNCTVTVLNPTVQPFAFIRVDPSAERLTHIRLERTLVRGWFTSGIEIGRATADVVLDRSMVLQSSGPIFRVSDCDSATVQRFYFLDTVLAGAGPIIDRAPATLGSQPKPIVIRSYGSAFGRIHGQGIASVICSAEPVTAASKQIEWAGDHNLFAGWRGYFAHGTDPMDPTIAVASLAAVRSTWNSSETASQEIPHPWRLPTDLSVATAVEFTPFLPNREPALRQIARPRSGLLEKTVSEYQPPWVPEPVSRAQRTNPRVNPGMVEARIVKPESAKGASPASAIGSPSIAAKRPANRDSIDVTFDTAVPPWNGDLGAFLKDQLADRVRFARVRVIGTGNHRSSAVRLPRGIHLEIRVEPTLAGPPSWSPDPQATGPGLIDAEGGALVLLNFVLHHDPASRLEHLIHVESGHLVLDQCQLTTPASSPGLTGDLIAFRSVTTQPIAYDVEHPVFSTFVDRPICLLIESSLVTSGTALKAELGRGLVALEQTAIAAGDAAIDLNPSRVVRRRFDCDLFLESCTLTAERAIVRAGPWPGLAPGPDRPWLVTSRNCAFLAPYDRPRRETVLLRADPSALAHGSVFWQAKNDAAEVDIFTALAEGPAQIGRSRDVFFQWISFWGRNHMQLVSGPRGAHSAPTVLLRERLLHPGRVEPADLILDPQYHPGRDRLSIGADLARQGITPKPLSARRRRG